jgi:OTU domain-containing protein 6
VSTDKEYESYVTKVEGSAEWGGQVELRACARALKRPIKVYSADSDPLIMGEEFLDGEEEGEGDSSSNEGKSYMLMVSYHRKYYALGEHYNVVVAKGS